MEIPEPVPPLPTQNDPRRPPNQYTDSWNANRRNGSRSTPPNDYNNSDHDFVPRLEQELSIRRSTRRDMPRVPEAFLREPEVPPIRNKNSEVEDSHRRNQSSSRRRQVNAVDIEETTPRREHEARQVQPIATDNQRRDQAKEKQMQNGYTVSSSGMGHQDNFTGPSLEDTVTPNRPAHMHRLQTNAVAESTNIDRAKPQDRRYNEEASNRGPGSYHQEQWSKPRIKPNYEQDRNGPPTNSNKGPIDSTLPPARHPARPPEIHVDARSAISPRRYIVDLSLSGTAHPDGDSLPPRFNNGNQYPPKTCQIGSRGELVLNDGISHADYNTTGCRMSETKLALPRSGEDYTRAKRVSRNLDPERALKGSKTGPRTSVSTVDSGIGMPSNSSGSSDFVEATPRRRLRRVRNTYPPSSYKYNESRIGTETGSSVTGSSSRSRVFSSGYDSAIGMSSVSLNSK